MILLQQIVAADLKYSVLNVQDLTSFDVHNDSPFNVGISFGADTGIQSADYFATAHSILYGLKPVYAGQRSIGGVKFNGTIFIYTQTPLGGVTNASSAPAQQVTIIGYQTGYQPSGTTSMSRMANIGNAITVATAQILNCTGLAPGTPFVFAEPVGDSSNVGTVQINNLGQMGLGDPTYNGSILITGPDTAQLSLTRNRILAFDKNGLSSFDIQSNPQTVLNGGTSGTATLNEPFCGTYKKVIIDLNNFRTAGATQSIALPTAFVGKATIITGDIGTSTTIAGISLLLSGVAQTVEIMTAPAVLGGTRNGATVFYGLSLLTCATGFDTIRFAAGSAGPSNGLIIIEGY